MRPNEHIRMQQFTAVEKNLDLEESGQTYITLFSGRIKTCTGSIFGAETLIKLDRCCII